MANAPTADQDAWILSVFGIDVAAPAGDSSAPTSKRGDKKAAGDGAGGKGAFAALKKAVGWGKPAAPTGPVVLTSETEARVPGSRARTKLGVGERVVLKVTGGSGKWTVTGAKINAKTGTTVTMIAPSSPGTAKVTVVVGGTTQSLSFTVIAPSEVHMVAASTEHENNSFPNAGMHCEVYIGPDDVNFGATTNSEDDCAAVATGYWAPFNGNGHQPSATPNGCDIGTVVSGRGTHSPGTDHVASGWIGTAPPDGNWSGTLTFNIPWRWQCGSGAGRIGNIVHRQVTDAAGSTTISKAGASFTAALSP